MANKEQYENNIRRWGLICPKEAAALLGHQCSRVFLCRTGDAELNLKKVVDHQAHYYHSSANAAEEARQWFSSLDLYQIDTLFVYGAGLGYYYQAAEEWLRGNQEKNLVFLENDLDVIHRLFETDLGTKLLFDEQVRLYYFPFSEDVGVEEISKSFVSVPPFFFLGNYRLSFLDFYGKQHPRMLPFLQSLLDQFKHIKTIQMLEYMYYGESYFRNFYRNLLELPTSFRADKLFGQFKGIPAIICGAGASLEKHLPLLETLGDRACIFAGGSSMNALNSHGFLPTFGVGLDPNWSQSSRLAMNQAYQVPYFYRQRLFSGGLFFIHGDHLYVPGSGGHHIAPWFEEKLGIDAVERISEGNNVVNFSLAIAAALGCNPIIFVGVDLAYTGDKSYAPGVLSHPIHDANQRPLTRGAMEEMRVMPDIYGQPVSTLWKWMMESRWVTEFALTHPELICINATEGGIGFQGIPNVPLSEAVDKHLNESGDIKGLVHSAIQNSRMPEGLSEARIIEAMEEMDKSLLKSQEDCSILRKEFSLVLKQLEKGKEPPQNLVTSKALESLKTLHREPAFQAILHDFNESFISFIGKQELEKYEEGGQEEIHAEQMQLKRAHLNKRRYEFLKAVIKTNLDCLRMSVKENRLRNMVMEVLGQISQEKNLEKLRDRVEKAEQLDVDHYSMEQDSFTISDEEMNIFIEEELRSTLLNSSPEEICHPGSQQLSGKYRSYYPNGAIKGEQYYREGVLHGPSTFFDEKGNLMSRCWYVNGVKQGKARLYDYSGGLHSLTRYRNGVWDGKQEFFYPTGVLKTELNYRMGSLHGEVILYYPNGIKKRELRFSEGKRCGTEMLWNYGGMKEQEIHYDNDQPVGKACAWHGNGRLAREIVYGTEGKPESVKGWTHAGVLLPEEFVSKDDYFDLVSKQTGTLTKAINEVFEQVKVVAPKLSERRQPIRQEGSPSPDLKQDLSEVKREMEKLKELHLELKNTTEMTSGNMKEMLWRTPETGRLLGKQLEEATKKMVQDVEAIEELIRSTTDFLPPSDQTDPSKENLPED
ncbi:MAG: 6-hydroxymethylpterin diphosphokinase MptE-like protein [Waddliaceae bacterium]